MLKKALVTTSMVALLSATLLANGNGRGNGNGHGQQLQALEAGTLTTTQQEGLVYILEEEKLARDVYIALDSKWNSRIFKNITKAEIRHIDAVANLLEKYGVEAPLTIDSVGEFENEELQELFNELVAKGKKSLDDAFEVGVEVEETDIRDIKDLLEQGVPSDFERVYNKLLKGSYKHLNAFNRQLSR